ncbi:MAG: hypothetical protein WCH46_02365 [bacterium]
MINGTTQDVPVVMPGGTEITELSGGGLTLVTLETGSTALRLNRKNDYSLKFTHDNHSVMTNISSRLDGGWLAADLFTYFVGYLVDAITGSWNSFDAGVLYPFGYSSIDTTRYRGNFDFYPYVVEKVPERNTVGIVISANAALEFVRDNMTEIAYGFGLGYRVAKEATISLEYEGGPGIGYFQNGSKYDFYASYNQISASCKLQIENSPFILLGAGATAMSVTSLKYTNFGYDSLGRRIDASALYPDRTDWVPAIFGGFGICSKNFYCELRHTIGLSAVTLPHDEKERLESTSLKFGVILHF